MAATKSCALIPSHKFLWKNTTVLKFWCDQDVVPWVQYDGSSLKSWQVRDLVVEGWSMEGIEHGEHVPQFSLVNDASKAQIIVHFGKYSYTQHLPT